MSVTHPTETEIRDAFLSELDSLNETRTEDRHPAPEFWQWLAHEGYTIVGMDAVAFADEVFHQWERVTVNEDTVHRFVTDREVTPSRIYETTARVIEDALSELDYLVRRYVIQPPARY